MKLGIENILSGMLIQHPNYEERVVVKSVVKDAPSEGGAFSIYWQHIGADWKAGLLQGIPAGSVLDVEDPVVREVMKSAKVLLDEIWEDGAGWNLTQQYKTAAHLLQVKVSALTCYSLKTIVDDPFLRAEVNLLISRESLLQRTVEKAEEMRIKA